MIREPMYSFDFPIRVKAVSGSVNSRHRFRLCIRDLPINYFRGGFLNLSWILGACYDLMPLPYRPPRSPSVRNVESLARPCEPINNPPPPALCESEHGAPLSPPRRRSHHRGRIDVGADRRLAGTASSPRGRRAAPIAVYRSYRLACLSGPFPVTWPFRDVRSRGQLRPL